MLSGSGSVSVSGSFSFGFSVLLPFPGSSTVFSSVPHEKTSSKTINNVDINFVFMMMMFLTRSMGSFFHGVNGVSLYKNSVLLREINSDKLRV